MNKSQRIWLDSGATDSDKTIYVKLEQDVESLEIMSLKLDTKEAYDAFNADYGVLIGRVTANEGVGIPNAKISIFIPLAEEDEDNSDIVSVYPYKTPRDKNNYGKRYNLLPRVAKRNPTTGDIKPQQPFGSFPIKEEIITNPTQLEVYEKYYKYTTVTNNNGDYMIFGVPIGVQTVHMSCDITDIGDYSMTPAAMVTNLGYSPNLFTNNGTRIKPSNDLEDLPNIETQEISVDVASFWGDTENFEIGITRQDFRIRATLVNTFILFGSAFTDGDQSMWGTDFIGSTRRIGELYRARGASGEAQNTIGIYSKRIAEITEKIYYYPANISDTRIDTGQVDPRTDMLKLDPSEYSVYKRDGDFVFIINCNRDKVVTDNLGNQIPVSIDSTAGVFTKFRGFITLEITSDAAPMLFSSNIGNNTKVEPYRYKLKFPQFGDAGDFFDNPVGGNDTTETTAWRQQHATFEAAKFYSISRFHPLNSNSSSTSDNDQFNSGTKKNNGFFSATDLNDAWGRDPFWNVGIIQTQSDPDGNYPNSQYEFPPNTLLFSSFSREGFGANWINLCAYLPQLGRMTSGYSHIKSVRTADQFHKQKEDNSGYNVYFLNNNTQGIAAGDFNTRFFARNDVNWTDIIEVPIEDIRTFNEDDRKGFNDTQLSGSIDGNYRDGSYIPSGWDAACPYGGGKDGGNPDETTVDWRIYFYKGFGDSNCIEFLFELGIVT